MSTSLWWIPLRAGLEDGVSPCALMTAALVLLGILLFKRLSIRKSWIYLLITSIFLYSFIFNCGFLDKLILNSYFQKGARSIYAFLLILVGYIGIKLLIEWFCLVRRKEIKSKEPVQLRLSTGFLILTIFGCGFLISMLASLWPINYYMQVFTMSMSTTSQLIPLFSLFLLYTSISLWLVYLIIWASSLEQKNQRLFKVIAAAVLLSASIGAVDIVFTKG